MKQLAASLQPEGENGWDDVIAVSRAIEEAEQRAEREAHDATMDISPFTDYSTIGLRPGRFDLVFGMDMDRKNREFTRSLVHHVRGADTIVPLNNAFTKPMFIRPTCELIDQDFGAIRKMSKLLEALGSLEAEEGARSSALDRAEQIKMLARIASHQIGAAYLLLSHALRDQVQSLALYIAEEEGLHADLAAEAIRLLEWTNPTDEDIVRNGLQLELLWAAAELYDGTGALRRAELRKARTLVFELGLPLDPEALDDAQAVFANFADTWQEMQTTLPAAMTAMQEKVIQNWKRSEHQVRSRELATQMFIAVRLHELENGTLPASLDDLVPDIIDELPTDPATDKPFGYKQLTDDPFGRTFIVYSYGRDGIDNGGNQHPTSPYHATSKDSDGYDFVINHVYFPEEDEADGD